LKSPVPLIRGRPPAAGAHRVDQQIKSLWVKEQTDSGKPAVAADQVRLEPADYERLLRKTYKRSLAVTCRRRLKPINPPVPRRKASPPNWPALPENRYLGAGGDALDDAFGTSQGGSEIRPACLDATAVLPAVPQTREELELADMREQLARKMEITNDDLRDLMQQRAAQVQAYLLKTGKVAAERLFLIAPKNVDDSFRGQDRVNCPWIIFSAIPAKD